MTIVYTLSPNNLTQPNTGESYSLFQLLLQSFYSSLGGAELAIQVPNLGVEDSV